ncbi:MAG: septation protein IspZ [Pseudomonadota bacterium]
MTPRTAPAGLIPALEYGPVAAFVISYLSLRNATFTVAGTDYSGFVAVTAAFIPIFLLAMLALWRLTGQLTRLQVAVTILLVIMGGLGVWMNDPTLIKMKPTVVYGALTLILLAGLLRGQSWLQFLLDEMIPMRDAGWRILTKRVTALCLLAALANEAVWRTQSETFWVLFETIAMPVIVLIFCLAQIPLVVDHASFKKKKRPKRAGARRRDQKAGAPKPRRDAADPAP